MKLLFIIISAIFVVICPHLHDSHATDLLIPTYNASTGAVSIPSLQVVGASAYYSVQMQQSQGLNFTVNAATSAATPTSAAYTATYNASSGAVNIPYLSVVGDNSGTTYSVNMQQQGQGLNFAVTSASPGSSSNTTYSTNDLNGTWMSHMLAAGDAPQKFGWWYGSKTYDSSGNLTSYSSVTDSILGTYPWTYQGNMTLGLTTDGVITVPGAPASLVFQGTMNKSKNMTISTGTFYPGSNTGVGAINLFVDLKKSGSFFTADLAGTWNYHALVVGDGANANMWGYGTQAISAEGVATYTSITRSNGNSTLPSGTQTFILAADGTLTSPTSSSLHGTMNSEKNMFVFTMNDGGAGMYDMIIAVKAGATFTQADMEGNWTWYGLQASEGANKWWRGNSTTDSSGMATFTSMLSSDGSTALPGTGTTPTVISTDGIISNSDNSSLHGVMSPNKELFVITKNPSGSAVTQDRQLWIGLKR